MIPEVNIISGKTNISSVHGTGGSGGGAPLRKSAAGVMRISIYKNTPKGCPISPPLKVTTLLCRGSRKGIVGA